MPRLEHTKRSGRTARGAGAGGVAASHSLGRVSQVIQVVGSLLVLAAFAALQARRMSPAGFSYLVLNLAGSAILAVNALVEHQWGFLLLETVWAAVSAWSLVRKARGRDVEAAAH